MQISIANSQSVLEIDEPFLREVAERTLDAERVAAADVSIALVDNAAIRELNRQYLGHDYETDVLSFLLECEQVEAPETVDAGPADAQPPRGAGKRIEGEVIVSAEMAVQTAGNYSWTPHDELVLYLVHGLLHLVGYDDLSDAEKQLMRSRERSLLKIWNLAPRYADPAEDDTVPDRSGPEQGVSGADP
jgi:probable rRNA maturation factor